MKPSDIEARLTLAHCHSLPVIRPLLYPSNGNPATLAWGRWHELKRNESNEAPDTGSLFILLAPWACGSDYGGNRVTLANYKELIKFQADSDSPNDILDMFGGHGTYGIAVRLTCSDELWKIVVGLADYPLIDEETMSDIEMEWQSEAMPDLKIDVYRIIADNHIPGGRDRMSSEQETMLKTAVSEALDSTDLEWEYEHSNAYCNAKKAAAAIVDNAHLIAALDAITDAISPICDARECPEATTVVRIMSHHSPPAFLDEWATDETDADFLIEWCARYYGPLATVNIHTPANHPCDK